MTDPAPSRVLTLGRLKQLLEGLDLPAETVVEVEGTDPNDDRETVEEPVVRVTVSLSLGDEPSVVRFHSF
jgi:hypothetical protein